MIFSFQIFEAMSSMNSHTFFHFSRANSIASISFSSEMIFAQASIITMFSFVQVTSRSRSDVSISVTVGLMTSFHSTSQTLSRILVCDIGMSDIAKATVAASQAAVS